MESLSEQQLMEWNARGLIPGPDESEEAFRRRADYCLALKGTLKEELEPHLPVSIEEVSSSYTEEGFTRVKERYGFAPDWAPLFFSNYQLAPWHGGCAWIFQISKETPLAALLQLKQTFRHRDRSLWCDRDELIAHESVHIGRMAFEEPRFEEMLAYQTSSSSFRRWFGPIIQAAWESLVFILVLLALFVLDTSLILSGHDTVYIQMFWLKGIPLVMIIWAFARLWQKHRQMRDCLAHLRPICSDAQQAKSVLFRLTDREIILFGKLHSKEILAYGVAQADSSLRWKILCKEFLRLQ